ncbi:hypothetical protein LMH87_012308 [Akanthomyces muscarius]|uniref:Uncharacterized protein n=1 Tax=Akanthomyces muscarius TaxID=2231603 RepID=A0A9W8QE86_AKAMU|nr:hypothetical protein LMH87_012308 [Akanthomyces muscarius]KAJ4151618.1 hypothetical protein LMH87_012308 [Akanthomyces muscarius]
MLLRNPVRFGSPMPWRPAGDFEAHWAVDRENFNLSLKGSFLGGVRSASTYRETVFRGGPPASGELDLDLASTWQKILCLVAESQDNGFPLSEDTLTACATSLCYGQDEACKPAEEAKLARNFVAYLKSVLGVEDSAKYTGSSFSGPDEQGDGTVFGKPVWDFEYPESSFFVMHDRSMGCCIAPVAPGDGVFVPLGCTYPLVLRPDGERGFRVRGYCFVHGAMHGERQTGRDYFSRY